MVLCMSQLQLSARAYHRILKLARTIADLAGEEEIQSAHLVEALHLRSSKDHDGLRDRDGIYRPCLLFCRLILWNPI